MKDIDEVLLPANLRYAEDHEYVSKDKPHRIGVSDFAQDQLGDLTFVELPEAGAALEKGGEFGSLESIKSVSSLYSPVDGKVVAVNTALADDPGLVNSDPYGAGWLIEVELANPAQLDALMDVDAYKEHLKKA